LAFTTQVANLRNTNAESGDMGFGLAAFITRTKLENSKQLLKYTNQSLSEISVYYCFSSQSHFQNSFKKQFGITPQQYRIKAKSEF
jgi:AraC-like DNA-binding protein